MTDSARDDRDLAGYSYAECFVCGGRLRVSDPTADRRVPAEDGGEKVERGHRACLKEGVERWNRENRPHSGPLAASRKEGWRWHSQPPTRLKRP
jgi:hypothetical protein